MPCQIFKDNNSLSLSPKATATLMVLYSRAKGLYHQVQRYPSKDGNDWININVSQKELSRKTGYSRNTLTSAVNELVAGKWLEPPDQRRAKRGELATNEYFLLHPKTGRRLRDIPVSPYFTVPTCIIRNEKMHWSLRSLSPPEVALYTTILFRANRERKISIANSAIQLRKLSNLSRGKAGTFLRAIEALQKKCLIVADEHQITLCDPVTGEPPVAAVDAVNDPANYYDSSDGKRITFNIGNPDALLKWVKASLPNGEDVIEENNGEYKIKCPFHNDRTPSLNFNPSKNIFHCFGCSAKGTIKKLVMQLTGIPENEAILQQSRALGVDPRFESPDSKAEAIYRYTNTEGTVLYEVLRFPGKRFSQRRWTPDGWVYKLGGVKKTLYNLPEIRFASIVIITEGEKDADRINNLQLRGYPDRRQADADPYSWEPLKDLLYKDCQDRRVVATTSGGAKSWQDSFADLLAPSPDGVTDQPTVIVMPDSDKDGQGYQDQIVRSLEKRSIPHCIVKFEGFKDVSEYLDAGHTGEAVAQRITDELMKIDGRRGVIEVERVPEERAFSL
jgi:CHC2 zinc finger/Helix-turn-helix domain